MERSNSKKKNKITQCDVCENSVIVNQYNNGVCTNCGWEQGGDAQDLPDTVRYPNLISLNKAIKLYQEGKSLNPDFEDFISMYNFYGEVEFIYKGTRYGVAFDDKSKCIMLFNTENNQTQLHKKIEDFIAGANINGKLLKDIWSEVENVDWLQ